MLPSSRKLEDLLPDGDIREVGNSATWVLSSCKAGYGVQQLRDGNTDTYWQSDGPQPHLVSIHFRRKTPLIAVALFADYKADESYTPSKLSVRVGSHYNDLEEIRAVELVEPAGWAVIDISVSNDSEESSEAKPVRAFLLQLAVLQNHQNGRDTHIRQIKVFAPTRALTSRTNSMFDGFSTVDMMQYSTVR